MKRNLVGRFFTAAFISVIILFVSMLYFVEAAFAGASVAKLPDTDVEAFKSQVTVSEKNEYSFEEVITVKLKDDDMLYVRKLPRSYLGRTSNVIVEGYESYFDEDNGVIEISAGEKGPKTFTIKYDVEGRNNLGRKKDSFDIIFLNGSECGRKDRIEEALFTLKCADGVEWEKLSLYAGKSTDKLSKYGSWNVSESDRVIRFEGNGQRGLRRGEPVRVHAVFPKGFWSNATEIGWTKTLSLVMFGVGILILIVMRIVFGREKEIVIRKTPFPPYNMNPLRMGYLVDGYVDDRDIIAQLMHLAERGYYTITEYERNRFRFEYKAYPSDEDQGSKLLFNAVFSESAKPGDTVLLENASKRIKKVIPTVRKKTARYFRGGRAAFTTSSKLGNSFIRFVYFVITAMLPFMNSYYHIESENDIEKGLAISICSSLALTFLLSRVCIEYMKLQRKQVDGNRVHFWMWTIAYLATSAFYAYSFRFAVDGREGDITVAFSAMAFLVIAPVMLFGFRSRGSVAADTFGQVQGFIEYMKDTRGAELEHTAGTDGKYFFRILPYAYIFGISKKIASNFQYIDIPAPDWYMPYGCKEGYVYDVVVMNSMLVNFEEGVFKTVFNR